MGVISYCLALPHFKILTLKVPKSNSLKSAEFQHSVCFQYERFLQIHVGVAATGTTHDGVPHGVLPHPAWSKRAMVLQPPPTQPLPKKPWVPKIWILFAVIGLLLLLAPSIMTFLINLEPVDHSDNGDGQYLLSGLLLIPCALFGLPTVLLAYCVGIAKRVMWVRAAGPHQTTSLCVGSRDCRYVA